MLGFFRPPHTPAPRSARPRHLLEHTRPAAAGERPGASAGTGFTVDAPADRPDLQVAAPADVHLASLIWLHDAIVVTCFRLEVTHRGVRGVRKVGRSGGVSFAGTGRGVGTGHRCELLEVGLAGGTAEISQGGMLIKTHALDAGGEP